MWSKILPLTMILALLLIGTQVVSGQQGSLPAGIQAAELVRAIREAAPGDTIYVDGGVFSGSLEIDKPLTLIGTNRPVIDGQGQGTVVHITSPGTTLSGFVIRNSGSSLDMENSGIAVEAPRVTVENNTFEDTLFGVYLREAQHSIVRDNNILGIFQEILDSREEGGVLEPRLISNHFFGNVMDRHGFDSDGKGWFKKFIKHRIVGVIRFFI